MSNTMTSEATLLPNGFGDVLPADARKSRHIMSMLMDGFARFGYQDVSPPLVEYEETLLASGLGAALADHTFRLMDPITGRMLALRSDMTAQIARVGKSRLGHSPRPLRLCYYGHVLRVVADEINPERQFVQIGAELIGATAPEHDAEVIIAALESLTAIGLKDLSLDLNVPRLLDVLLGDDDNAPLREAVRHKDSRAVAQLAHPKSAVIKALLELPLCAQNEAVERLNALGGKVGDDVRALLGELASLASLIAEAVPAVALILDPLEHCRLGGLGGLDYHQGVGFSIFTSKVRSELGRGGRYGGDEISTGLTLYLERVLRAAPTPKSVACVYVAADYGIGVLAELARTGKHGVMGSHPSSDSKACKHEAEALGASAIYSPSKNR